MLCDDPEALRLMSRFYRLRKMGLCTPVLQDDACIWTFDNPADPWGSRRRISLDEFRRMIEQAEGRKPVQSEHLAAKEQEKTA